MRSPLITREPPGPNTLKYLLAPVILLVIASNAANLLFAQLVDTNPLLLIALSSINRYLILVTNDLDAFSYYTVGTLRLLVSDPLFFLLGYWYGDKALEWMDVRSPNYGRMLRSAQKWFGRTAWPLILVAPNNFICLFAGAAGMHIGFFFLVNLIGTVGRLYMIRVAGDVFSSPLDSVTDFIAQYRLWFIAASAVAVGYSLWSEFKGGNAGELDALRHLADEDDDQTEAGDEHGDADHTDRDESPLLLAAHGTPFHDDQTEAGDEHGDADHTDRDESPLLLAAHGTPFHDEGGGAEQEQSDDGSNVLVDRGAPLQATTRRDSEHPSLTARTPHRTEDFFDEAQLAELRAYVRPLKRVRLAMAMVAFAIDAVLIFGFDLGPEVAGWVGDQGWVIRLFVVAAVFSAIHALVTLPSSVWATLVHDKRHGLSNQTVGTFVGDQLKDYVLGLILLPLIFVPVLAAVRTFDTWWLIGGLAFFAIQLVLVFVYPVAIMPRFNKFTPMEPGPVRTRVEEVAALSGVEIEGVYTMDGSKRSRRANAFVAGFGPTTRVVVFDTMMDEPIDELSQVIAHEIGHYRLNHIRKMFPFAAVQILVALAFVQYVGGNETVLGWAGVDDLGDPAALPVFLLALGIPMAGLGIISAYLSRKNEREADLEALELLGDPSSFVSMWPRMVERNKADLEPGWWDRLNASHPGVPERMQFGIDWARMNDVAVTAPDKASVPPPSVDEKPSP